MGKKLWSLLIICIFSVGMAFAQKTVTGTVIDRQTGEPVVGASVRAKGLSLGVATDINGMFKFTNLPNEVTTLTVSFIGMETADVNVKSKMTVYLTSSAKALDETVVVAYGTQKKSSLTGSVSQIDNKVIEQHVATSVTAALEGAAPGIQVNNTYGEPGAAPSIRIRGFSSINGSNAPLYVVDGVIYDGNIAEINSADIDNISVLKDAASAALYGNRASNGVVIITTKKGRGGNTPSITLNVNQGIFSRGIKEYDRMGTKQWMETSWIAMKNFAMNGAMGLSEADAAAYASANVVNDYCHVNIFDKAANDVFDANGKLTANVLPGIAGDLDWQDAIEQNGHRQEYILSSSMSTEKSNVFSSIGYLKEKGYIKTTEYERFTARVNASYNPYKWVKTGINLNAAVGKRNYQTNASSNAYANPFYQTRYMAPVYPVHAHDAAGDFIYDDKGNPQYNFESYLDRRNIAYEIPADKAEINRNSINVSSYATAVLPYGFDFTVKGAGFFANNNYSKFGNKEIGDGAANGGRLNTSSTQTRSLTFQQLLNWKHSFEDVHNFNVLLGHESYAYRSTVNATMKTKQSLEGAAVNNNFLDMSYIDGYIDEDKSESYFARLAYDFNEKYMFEASWRADGSSRFHKDNRWGSFFSVGGAWNMKSESFLSDVDIINNMKLRAAYGQVGNNAGASLYSYMALYELTKNGGNTALVKNSLSAKDLKWESTNTIDVAVEGRMFDFLNFSIGYFDKRSDQLIFAVRLPLTAGGNAHDEDYQNMTQLRNIGKVSNSGVEIALDADVIKNRDWTWNVGFDASFVKSKVVKLYDGEDIQHGQQRYSEGKDTYSWYTYHFEGVDQLTGRSLYTLDPDKKDAAQAAGNLVTINGVDYTMDTAHGLRDFRGKATPDVYGALKSALSWRNWHLDMLFTYSLGGKIYDSAYASLMSTNTASSASAYHKDLADSWMAAPAGMTEDASNRINPDGLPAVDFQNSSKNNAASDRWLTSASYFVFKNINLSYTLPKRLTNSWGINGITVNGGIENLFTITSRQGLNPQYSFTGGSDDTYVTARIYNIGLTFNF